MAWNFRWFAQPNGRCAITENKTRLDATITLPDLVSADSPAIKKFSNYIRPLTTHEMGHVQVGRKAAQQIDAQILALPAMESCTVLEKAANAIGYALLEKAKEEERQYDLKTEHGKKQGAWLTN